MKKTNAKFHSKILPKIMMDFYASFQHELIMRDFKIILNFYSKKVPLNLRKFGKRMKEYRFYHACFFGSSKTLCCRQVVFEVNFCLDCEEQVKTQAPLPDVDCGSVLTPVGFN